MYSGIKMVEGGNVPVIKCLSHGDIMYSMVTTVIDNDITDSKVTMRINSKVLS